MAGKQLLHPKVSRLHGDLLVDESTTLIVDLYLEHMAYVRVSGSNAGVDAKRPRSRMYLQRYSGLADSEQVTARKLQGESGSLQFKIEAILISPTALKILSGCLAVWELSH
ncbi:uncharacterized protein K489DRAFT_369323 [Dissoconium aciculare CBS 342.82]|uniref:Uncharacterized protein n=1 Tax=Dissoconium aciculare CBS 342.82 TaxID=1314786 RepID=A0A6J3M9Z9_9PEZI|nr:uncharacterized protein K489DRAFT_369323 [Dissoconium aciculare CBS 342.82]KAF1824454.1 hypothetical protein K489DRAFT_369323 [Dissoconium aciculare CBS 342.82]